MVMVAHQNPRINKPSGLFASFTKGLNEDPPILVASDNALSAVTLAMTWYTAPSNWILTCRAIPLIHFYIDHLSIFVD
jgi:hypothetical protein